MPAATTFLVELQCAQNTVQRGRIHYQRTFFSGTYRSLEDQPKLPILINVTQHWFFAANIADRENNNTEINYFAVCVTARCRHWQHNYASAAGSGSSQDSENTATQHTCGRLLFVCCDCDQRHAMSCHLSCDIFNILALYSIYMCS